VPRVGERFPALAAEAHREDIEDDQPNDGGYQDQWFHGCDASILGCNVDRFLTWPDLLAQAGAAPRAIRLGSATFQPRGRRATSAGRGVASFTRSARAVRAW
jgi:hypothetical protein